MTVDPGSRGWNEHTHVTVERPTDELIFTSDDTTEDFEPLLHIPAGSDSLCMHVPDGYAFVSAKDGSFLAANAYWDGTNWLRINTANPVCAWVAEGGYAQLRTAPAGSGNIAWTTVFTISQTGAVTAGAITAPSLTASGTVTAGGLTTAYISNSGGSALTNRVSIAGGDGAGIGDGAGSYGNLEVQSSGGGAAKIAFHRPGAYAAYLGLDTDNQWAVGGWSMGAVRHVITTNTQTQTLSNKTHSGHFYMSGGYIFGTYVNMTADRTEAGGAAPAYVAGQNGDGYLRWYAKSNLVAPLTHLIVQGVSPRSTAWQRAATTWVNRTGYWLVVALNHCHDTSYGGNSRNGVQVVINGADGGSTIFHGNTYGGQIGSWPLKVMWLGVMSNGQEIACNVFAQDWDTNERNTTGQVEAWFIPTPGYMA